MKRTMGLVLGLLLLCGAAAVAAAQDQAAMHGPPKVLVVGREWVKPGHGGPMHEKTESAFVQAMMKANWPVHYFAMESMSGKNRALFLTGYDSLEAWEKDTRATAKNASLSSALDQAYVGDGNLLDATDQSVLVLDEDMSLRDSVDIPHMRYMEIQLFHIKPGRAHEWDEAVKMVKAAYEKSMPEAKWAMFRLVYGGAVGTYVVFTPMKSLAEVDAMMGGQRKFAEAMGEDGMKKLLELESASVESRERQLFSFSPKMSYAPPEWIKADPDFWAPKTKTTSAPATKKPAAKAAAGQQ
jgi:hypothetical protein